jgi:hypothetical protein
LLASLAHSQSTKGIAILVAKTVNRLQRQISGVLQSRNLKFTRIGFANHLATSLLSLAERLKSLPDGIMCAKFLPAVSNKVVGVPEFASLMFVLAGAYDDMAIDVDCSSF